MKLLENIFNKDRDETLVQFDKEALKRKVTKPIKVVGKKLEETWEWSKQHPTEAIMIGTTVVTGGYNLARLVTKNRQIRHDQFITDCRMYDRKYDEYVVSKRKLTNDEALYVQRMYDRGQSKRQSLIDLGLIR